MTADTAACLVLRLAAPLQSWGSPSAFNRRDTQAYPTKSGVIGLLAAATGRRREDPILDLLSLDLGVRIDQPGSLLRDYHTVSDYSGAPLLSAGVDSKGRQKSTSPKRMTAVTQRFYLQDAIFVAAVHGDARLLACLAAAIANPGFPLALGRRSCAPTQPLLLRSGGEQLWPGDLATVLGAVPWQATEHHRRQTRRSQPNHIIQLPTVVDDPFGSESATDAPTTFVHRDRRFAVRRVTHGLVDVPTGWNSEAHDPMTLLGG